MSRRSGTLRRRLAPSERSVAQRMGRAAFFAPLIRTVPRSGVFPLRTLMASMDALTSLWPKRLRADKPSGIRTPEESRRGRVRSGADRDPDLLPELGVPLAHGKGEEIVH